MTRKKKRMKRKTTTKTTTKMISIADLNEAKPNEGERELEEQREAPSK